MSFSIGKEFDIDIDIDIFSLQVDDRKCSGLSEGPGFGSSRGVGWILMAGMVQDAGLLGFCDITDRLCRAGIEFAR